MTSLVDRAIATPGVRTVFCFVAVLLFLVYRDPLRRFFRRRCGCGCGIAAADEEREVRRREDDEEEDGEVAAEVSKRKAIESYKELLKPFTVVGAWN